MIMLKQRIHNFTDGNEIKNATFLQIFALYPYREGFL